jgi:4'-phosphopantetheinyl transferase
LLERMLRVYKACLGSRLSKERERNYLAGTPESICRVIHRYRRWEDRQARLFGKLLLQYALHRIAANRTSSFLEQLEYTESGKPFIRGEGDLNISHSGDVVVLALVDNGYVGIDVEKIRPIPLDDFSYYLPEVSKLEARDTMERLSMFYACWTRKEAVLKGIGSGLQIPLEQVKLSEDTAFIHDQVWHLEKIDCGTEYRCNVATSFHHAVCRIEVVNF